MNRQSARGLPFRKWPEADRTMWEQLTRDADPFEDPGLFNHLRPSSLETLRVGYGMFLGFAAGQGKMDLAPELRPTEITLRSWLDSLSGVSPRTKHGYFVALLRVMMAAFPSHDWSLLHRGTNSLLRLARAADRNVRKTPTPRAQEVLAVAETLLRDSTTAPTCRQRAEMYRDGVMLLFLVHHPIRLQNFVALELGKTLKPTERGLIVQFDPGQTKTKRAISFMVAPAVAERLDQYLDSERHQLLKMSPYPQPSLWVRATYGAWGKEKLGRHISDLTERYMGMRITPHNFRHIAATTIASSNDIDVRTAQNLLAHATLETTETYYNRASQVDASETYVRTLRRRSA